MSKLKGRLIALKLHVKYNGHLGIGKCDTGKDLFTDPLTHDTFAASNIKEAKEKLKHNREAFNHG